ncbi:Protein transport protein SEC20 [Candida viswanathii]|uniref:Protein transport protein SEC20 n=1 Tax=Candida viswanathii TaxID=5486 RepID=A0A367XW74_9ASCO|nr:Protein transport protein SEC20 [Candida viswanathii]
MTIPYYAKLDQLQTQIFDLFSALAQLPALDDEANFQTTYNNITQEIDQLLIAYKDYLRILKSKDKSNTYKTYELKYQSLKQKLRNLQVYINDQKQDRLHDYRIKHFHLEDTTKGDSQDNTTSARDQLFANRSRDSRRNPSCQQLLSASILQSELNIESLDQQTKDLYKLNENFLQFNDLLNKSKQIVKFIEKQDKADRQRIYLSMGFFILCCTWVVYRRILRRPIKILLWSFFKIFNIFGWLLGSGKDDLVEMSTAEVLMTTAITATTSIVEEISEATSLVESIVESLSTGESIVQSLASTVTERIVDEL